MLEHMTCIHDIKSRVGNIHLADGEFDKACLGIYVGRGDFLAKTANERGNRIRWGLKALGACQIDRILLTRNSIQHQLLQSMPFQRAAFRASREGTYFHFYEWPMEIAYWTGKPLGSEERRSKDSRKPSGRINGLFEE